jgi:hypothetical protein
VQVVQFKLVTHLLETRRESFNLLLLLCYGYSETLLQLHDGPILFLKAHRKIQEQELRSARSRKGWKFLLQLSNNTQRKSKRRAPRLKWANRYRKQCATIGDEEKRGSEK